MPQTTEWYPIASDQAVSLVTGLRTQMTRCMKWTTPPTHATEVQSKKVMIREPHKQVIRSVAPHKRKSPTAARVADCHHQD